jgi:hypothetical protein
MTSRRPAATAPSAAPPWPRRSPATTCRQPAGRRAADPALVRRGPGRGAAGRPRRAGRHPGPALRRRALAGFLEDRRAGRVGGTTAVFDRRGPRALLLQGSHPLHRADRPTTTSIPVFHHVGVYAYRPAALLAYPPWPEGRCEVWEGLEQLRFLETASRALRGGRGPGHASSGSSTTPRTCRGSRRSCGTRASPERHDAHPGSARLRLILA